MSINAGIVPYSYGDLVSISHEGPKSRFWFLAKDGSLRGVVLDLTNPAAPKLELGGDAEIMLKRGGVNDSTARLSLYAAKTQQP